MLIAWSLAEPSRVGEIAIVPTDAKRAVVGRGGATDTDGGPRLRFGRLRPGVSEEGKPLEGSGLSRQQLAVRFASGGHLVIERLGRQALRVNGVATDRAEVMVGDRLTIDGQLVLLVISRPGVAAPSRVAAFAFGEPGPFGLVGESEAIWRLREQIAFFAQREGHVLVLGASGAGKEVTARALHSQWRAGGPFVARNAATLPPELIDAELFGCARGYPSAGAKERVGLVGEAEGGTLFLDGLSELAEPLQAHLLRLLDTGEYHRLGDDEVRRANVRFVGAASSEETLKPELLARMKMRLDVPPFSERRDDIPLLIRFLLRRIAGGDRAIEAQFFEAAEARVDPNLVEGLLTHAFRGNVRELESLLLLAMSESTDDFVALTPAVRARIEARRPPPTRDEIEAALESSEGNVSRAWKNLGLSSRDALNRLIKKHKIVPGRRS